MTTVKLVSANTHKVNVLNLVPYYLMEHSPERWYGCCRGYVDNEYPWLSSKSGSLELAIMEKFECNLRSMTWDQHQDFLNQLVESAAQNKQDLFFGSHSHSQLVFLKNFFGNQSFIVALNYQENLYEFLLEDLALVHIHMLKTNAIKANEYDTEAMRTKTPEQLVDHYKLTFDGLNYIPHKSNFVGDYEIMLDDYFVPERMRQHFDNIGFPIQHTSDNFYKRWYDRYSQTLR